MKMGLGGLNILKQVEGNVCVSVNAVCERL